MRITELCNPKRCQEEFTFLPCIQACYWGAIKWVNETEITIDKDACVDCKVCMQACPTKGAIVDD